MIRSNSQPWFFIDADLLCQDYNLSQDIIIHIKAKRLKVGQIIMLFNRSATLAEAELLSTSKAKVISTCMAQNPKHELALSLPYTDPKTISNCLIKATELGCQKIYLTHTEYSYSNGWHNKINDKHHEKWQKQIIQACQQSENQFIPEIIFNKNIEDLLALEATPIVLGFNKSDLKLCTKPSIIFVGPEGGYSPKEQQQFYNRSARTINFGNTILKVETAATAGLATFRYLANDQNK